MRDTQGQEKLLTNRQCRLRWQGKLITKLCMMMDGINKQRENTPLLLKETLYSLSDAKWEFP